MLGVRVWPGRREARCEAAGARWRRPGAGPCVEREGRKELACGGEVLSHSWLAGRIQFVMALVRAAERGKREALMGERCG